MIKPQHKYHTPACHGQLTFWGVYHTYKEECALVYKQTGWAGSTISAYDSYMDNHILPALERHNDTSIATYTLQDFEKALAKIRAKGQGKSGENWEAYDEKTISQFRALMRAVVTVAANHSLCKNVFDEPQDSNKKAPSYNTVFAQTPKSLTVSQEIAVTKYLNQHCQLFGQVLGLLLMFALGLRNEEACGVNFGHICEMTEYPGNYYLIIPQTTKIGRNSLKLSGKTPNANRFIPLPNSIVTLLFNILTNRMEALKKRDNGIQYNAATLPIVCFNDNYTKRCASQHLTDAAKIMFTKVGFSEEALISLAQELQAEYIFAEENGLTDEIALLEKDPTAYLLRRNFATHLIILGLDEAEREYIIGHAIEVAGVRRRDFTDEVLLLPIKRKLDKRPLLNNIPELNNIYMKPNQSVDLQKDNHVQLHIPAQTTQLTLNVVACESGDEIGICTIITNPDVHIMQNCSKYVVSSNNTTKNIVSVLREYHDSYRKALRNDIAQF